MVTSRCLAGRVAARAVSCLGPLPSRIVERCGLVPDTGRARGGFEAERTNELPGGVKERSRSRKKGCVENRA